jgi:hypothetical protein
MPFDQSFRDTYLLGIKPACEEAGYYCERLDEQIFEETMLERIYNQIAKADLVVADLSERNPNVFYETGYAHALGARVILLTRNSGDIPFDLKHHFHIVYSEGIADLKSRLRERAAYYALNPRASTRNPFDQITLLLNGQVVDCAAAREAIPVVANSRLVTLRDNDRAWALNINAAFHLRDDSVAVEPVEVEVRLITDVSFPLAGWELPDGPTQIYTTISMPGGDVMHKPLNTIRVSPGDPDKVEFDLLLSEFDYDAQSSLVMTLRLISAGLRRDLQLHVSRGRDE